MIFFLIALGASTNSCQEESQPPELRLESYYAFSAAMAHQFNLIISEVKNSQGSFRNYEDFRNASQTVLNENFSYFEEAFQIQFKYNSTKNGSSEGNSSEQEAEIPHYLQEVVDEVNKQLDELQTDKEFIDYLKAKFELEYASNKYDSNEKDRILTYLVSYYTSMSIIKDHPEVFQNDWDIESGANISLIDSPKSGWFSWKCLASVVGSAMTGALVGCAGVGGLGATIGTAILPGAGTIIGGVGGCALGGRIGALGGAIYSASKC